jgi:hypothetical protein
MRCCVSAFTVVFPFEAVLIPIKAQFDRSCGGCRAFQNHRRARTIRRSHVVESRMADKVSDNKNVLYLIIGVLIVAVAVLSFNLYQAKKQPEGLQINVGPDGLKIQNK